MRDAGLSAFGSQWLVQWPARRWAREDGAPGLRAAECRFRARALSSWWLQRPAGNITVTEPGYVGGLTALARGALPPP